MKLKDLILLINRDFSYIHANSLLRKIDVFLTNPSFRLLLNYRIGRYLALKSGILYKFIRRYFSYSQITKRNCQISYLAEIGNDINFPHPIGIVIGDKVKIGDGVKIWQNVTIGSHGRINQGMEYPVIGDKVRIFEGATIIGNVTIGDNATIGSKSLVNKNVTPYSTVFGIPAKVKI